MLTAKVDNRRRITVPARPGQVMEILENGDGTITIAPLKSVIRKSATLPGIAPLSKRVLERYYRELPADDGIDDIQKIMDAQAFE